MKDSAPAAMLAHKWLDHKEDLLTSIQTKEISYLYQSPKYDGIRCVAVNSGLYSRNKIKFQSCDHIHNDVKIALEKYYKKTKKRFALDGELFMMQNDTACFEKICTAVKKTHKFATEEDYKLQRLMRYHVFDCVDLSNPGDMTYEQRQEVLQDIVSTSSDHISSIEIVPITKFQAEDEIEQFMENVCGKLKLEGVIVRTPCGKYEVGKRSHDLLKYVSTMESEFDIFDVNEGVGKFKGTLGSLVCMAPNGRKFSVNPGVDDETRQVWWKKRGELVGKKATVRFQRYTTGGVPRFPSAKSIRNLMKMRV